MSPIVLIGVLGTGLLAGSFLNLVSDRLKRKENFVTGRSKCEFCQKELKSLDLIPVFSYLINKGKCKYCLKKLSPI
jgi:prepilin signal peptidase PulO-like enzyme (type II secretory pathway)